MLESPLPIIGFCAYSGTGKTTLLTRLIPLLNSHGLRVGVVKHAHHSFDLGSPGKDIQLLRRAGAEQLLVASRRRIAWIAETPAREDEPRLGEILTALDPGRLDLVLVEGFKHEPIPKIELHRPAMGTPLLCLQDSTVVAIASDTPLLAQTPGLCQLDLNRPDRISAFIVDSVCHGVPAKRACGTQPYAH